MIFPLVTLGLGLWLVEHTELCNANIISNKVLNTTFFWRIVDVRFHPSGLDLH